MVNETHARILLAAREMLSADGTVSLDSVARQVGLTKPGLMHHFPSKEALMVALVDAVIDQWEEQLTETLGAEPAEVGAVDRIGAYARFVLSQDFDRSDVVVFADPRLHRTLVDRWEERMTPWWSVPDDATETTRTRLLAVRLLADGAWFASASGMLVPSPEERRRLRPLVEELLAGAR
ncbi:MAG TPA: TetR/AcrR family transcriptional regulator [Ruania sp.]|nr:TetR/AcrR family transcriptional regulator [Ruania sp.]